LGRGWGAPTTAVASAAADTPSHNRWIRRNSRLPLAAAAAAAETVAEQAAASRLGSAQQLRAYWARLTGEAARGPVLDRQRERRRCGTRRPAVRLDQQRWALVRQPSLVVPAGGRVEEHECRAAVCRWELDLARHRKVPLVQSHLRRRPQLDPIGRAGQQCSRVWHDGRLHSRGPRRRATKKRDAQPPSAAAAAAAALHACNRYGSERCVGWQAWDWRHRGALQPRVHHCEDVALRESGAAECACAVQVSAVVVLGAASSRPPQACGHGDSRGREGFWRAHRICPSDRNTKGAAPSPHGALPHSTPSHAYRGAGAPLSPPPSLPRRVRIYFV
jgi:hypothetical protein